jgi:hypothetical protein
MSQACFVSARIAGRCSTCKTVAKLVHCPRRLKTLHCEACCPICSQQDTIAVPVGPPIEPREQWGENA